MAERIVYLHGVPHSGEMWQPFIARTGGVAPDLPGFGSSAKPASGDYTFAILRLYRSAPEDVLADAGRELGLIKAPALVVWGDEDPYLPSHFADDYAAVLGGPAEVEHVAGAGHWPWFEKPAVVERVGLPGRLRLIQVHVRFRRIALMDRAAAIVLDRRAAARAPSRAASAPQRSRFPGHA
jgi:pimeloyl-ACP methyl ester carboxylesterase